VGGSWRCDETYIKVKGRWLYLYRAVDKAGKSVDFNLSRNRDVAAAKAFLRKAMRQQRTPTKITLDAYAASHRAVADLKRTGELPKCVRVRSSKYLNNIMEQDHRRVKHRLGPMLGLKSFRTVAVVISGIELAEKTKKGSSRSASLADPRQPCRKSGEPRWPRNRIIFQPGADPTDHRLIPDFALEPIVRTGHAVILRVTQPVMDHLKLQLLWPRCQKPVPIPILT
jgi:transposase-like protein